MCVKTESGMLNQFDVFIGVCVCVHASLNTGL